MCWLPKLLSCLGRGFAHAEFQLSRDIGETRGGGDSS